MAMKDFFTEASSDHEDDECQCPACRMRRAAEADPAQTAKWLRASWERMTEKKFHAGQLIKAVEFTPYTVSAGLAIVLDPKFDQNAEGFRGLKVDAPMATLRRDILIGVKVPNRDKSFSMQVFPVSSRFFEPYEGSNAELN